MTPPLPPGWGGLDIPAIITATASAASAAVKHAAPFLSMESTTGRISPLKWLHLQFFCSIATDTEELDIWGEVAASPTNQEELAILSQYLLTGMESCQREFHGHVKLLQVGGGCSTSWPGTGL